MYASSEGSGESAQSADSHVPLLLADVISTKTLKYLSINDLCIIILLIKRNKESNSDILTCKIHSPKRSTPFKSESMEAEFLLRVYSSLS